MPPAERRTREDDNQLLRRFLAGDAAACRGVERWAREIVHFRPYGIPRDEHDDVVQQAVSMLWRACAKPGFALHTSLRALVRTIVMARCIDWLRRRRATFELDEALVDPRPGPEQAPDREDEWARVRWALQRLGEGCREIIRLHFLEERPYAEIAEHSGRAEATLRVRMFNCMKEIRKLLGAATVGLVLVILGSFATQASAGTAVDAELEARQRIEDLEGERSPDSLVLASALDELVLALSGRGMARDPETRLAASRSLGIRERAFGPSHPEVAAGLVRSGDLFFRTGDYRAARPAYERALAIREKAFGPDHPDVAESLERLGGLHHRLAEHTAAERLLERALAIREKTAGAGSFEVAIDLNNLALVIAQTGGQVRARPLLERALAIAEKADVHRGFPATITYNLAAVREDLGDLAAARALSDDALETWIKTLIPELPSPRWLSSVLSFLPRDLNADFPGRHLIEERALQMWEMGLGPGQPRVWPRLMKSRNLTAAGASYGWWEPVLGRFLAMAEKLLGPEHPDLAYVLNMLGNNHQEVGDFTGARRSFERALALSEKGVGAGHPDVAMSLSNLGLLLTATGDHDEALALALRAEKIFRASFGPESREVGMMMNHLGLIEAERHDRAAAHAYHERSLAIWEKAHGSEHLDVAFALTNLAVLHEASGDLAAARPLYERALRLKEDAQYAEHPVVHTSLTGLARLDAAKGDWEAARQKCARALAVIRKANGETHPSAAYVLVQLAELERRAGNPSAALEHALAAEEIAREHLRVTARALSEREALRYAAERRSGLDLALSIACERGASDSAAVRGTWDALVRSRASVFDEMASRHRAIVASDDPDVATLAADLAAARERLAHLLVRSMRAGATGADPARLERARAEKEDLERRLGERSGAVRAERARGRIGLPEVAGALESGDALVAYVRFRRAGGANTPEGPHYGALVARAGAHPRVVPLGAAGPIEAAVERFRSEMTIATGTRPWREGESEARCRTAGAVLRRAIWDPLGPHLGGASRVFVVPDGAIHLVSFAALPAGSGYLVEAGPLLHQLSAERDLVPASEVAGNRGLLALGAPDFDAPETRSADLVPPSWAAEARAEEGKDSLIASAAHATHRGARSGCGEFRSLRFDPLPASAREAQWVAKLWGERPRETLAGTSDGGLPAGGVEDRALALTAARAGEAALKRLGPGRRILHVATHGFFVAGCGPWAGGRAESPLLLSGLALAGANRREVASADREDGILTAEEIAALDLSGVEWAVLSACNTGLGKLQSGEGVFGLKRAFQVAGASTVIMSLWSVEDEDVRRWMQALYEARLVRRRDTARAVREASLEVLGERRAAKRGTHPVHWAAFVAAGDWR